MKNRLSILLVLTAAALLALRTSATAASAVLPDTSNMNVLFLIIEDWNAGTPGSYGNPICRTPQLDRFARTAVQFNAAYVQAVSCNPSRSSFLTGLRPLTSGVWNNSQNMAQSLPAGTPTKHFATTAKREGMGVVGM